MPSCARAAALSILAMSLSTNVWAGIPDTDSDGFVDFDDNCVLIFNALQTDSDEDGWGNACDADFNNDGTINLLDFSQLTDAFATANALFDLNEDGWVNLLDIARFRDQFLGSPGPAGSSEWIAEGDGDWDNPDNWFPAAVPPPQALVMLESSSDVTVTFRGTDGSREVAEVVTGALVTLDIDAPTHTLKINGTLSAFGPVEITRGTLDVAGDANINQGIDIFEGTLANAHLMLDLSLQITNTLATLSNVTVSGDIEVFPNATLNVVGTLRLETGEVVLQCEGALSQLTFTGNGVIEGSGQVRFAGFPTSQSNSQCRIQAASPNDTLSIENGIQVIADSSGGAIASPAQVLHLNGDIINTTTPESATINISAGLVDIAGTLVASNAGSPFVENNFFLSAVDVIARPGAVIELIGGVHTINSTLLLEGNAQTNVIGGGLTVTRTIASDTSDNLSAQTDAIVRIGGSYQTQALPTISRDESSVIQFIGLLDNTGDTLDLDQTGLSLGNGGSISGGTISGTDALELRPNRLDSGGLFTTTSGSLANVILSTDVLLQGFANLTLSEDITLNGTEIKTAAGFEQPSSIVMAGGTVVGGTGEIVFGGGMPGEIANSLTGGSVSLAIIEAGVGIRSDFSSGLSVGGQLEVRGNIVLNDPDGDEFSFRGSPFRLAGTLQLSGLGTSEFTRPRLRMRDEWEILPGGALITNNARVKLEGQWTNNGTINLANSVLEIDESTPAIGQFGNFTNDFAVDYTGNINNTGDTLDIGIYSQTQFRLRGTLTGGTVSGNATLVLRGPNARVESANLQVNVATLFVGASSSTELDNVTLGGNLFIEDGTTVRIQNDLILENSVITLGSTSRETRLLTDGDVNILGAGIIEFAGADVSSPDNKIELAGLSPTLTIDNNVFIQTSERPGNIEGTLGATLQLNGGIISSFADEPLTVDLGALQVDGSLTAGVNASIVFGNTAVTFGPDSAVNIDLSASGNGFLDFSDVVQPLDGTLNVTLVDAFTPDACQSFDVVAYMGATGSFSEFNGPDVGGELFTLVQDTQSIRVVAPGVDCLL